MQDAADRLPASLPEDSSIKVLVDTAKMRWRIERDYKELNSDLGPAYFEGKSWRGIHYHATLCIAACDFMIRERADFPLQAPASAKELAFPAIGDPSSPPVRPERHVQNTIATVRKTLTVVLAKTLARCPCC